MGDPLFLSPQLKMFFPPGAQTHEGSEHMFWPDGQDSNRSIPFGWGTLPLRSSFCPSLLSKEPSIFGSGDLQGMWIPWRNPIAS